MRAHQTAHEITRQYAQAGFASPIRVLDEDETQTFASEFRNFYAQNQARLNSLLPREQSSMLSETHTAREWVYHLITHPRVLDAVELVLGPNLLAWGSRWFIKMPGDKTYVSWHQDGTYWGLKPPNVTTAWIALSSSCSENGCMRVIPGSHRLGLLPQNETYAPENALSRGQEIAVEVDEDQAVDLVLEAGEMSLHHIGIVHGSKVNTSDKARIGIAVRYIAPEVVQTGSDLPYAMLVRGEDRYNHFEHLLAPDPAMSEAESEAVQRTAVQRMLNSILDRRNN
jgi:non-haem Fe2+, alpha-ketoglutarate-dependent halogenase